MLLRIIVHQPLFKEGSGLGELTQAEERLGQSAVGREKERGGLDSVRQGEDVLRQLPCGLVLCPHKIKGPQSKQCLGELWSVLHLLAQRPGAGIGVLYLGSLIALRGHQRWPTRLVRQTVSPKPEQCAGDIAAACS